MTITLQIKPAPFVPLWIRPECAALSALAPRRGSDQRAIELWGIQAIERLDAALLDCICHLSMLHKMARDESLGTLFAADQDEFALANVLGLARFNLLDAESLGWRINEVMGDKDGDVLRGFNLGKRIECIRSTVAMAEAYANNLDDKTELTASVGGALILSQEANIKICTAVGRIIDDLAFARDEVAHAKAHLTALVGSTLPERSQAQHETPAAPAGKAPAKASKKSSLEASHA